MELTGIRGQGERPRATSWRFAARLIAGGAVAAIALSGCTQKRAELASGKAEENVKLLREFYEADAHAESKGLLDEAEKSLKSGKQSLDGKQSKEALAQSQEAVAKSRSAIKEAQQPQATKKQKVAEDAWRVCDTNSGSQENPALYAKTSAELEKGRKSYAAQKYDDAIKSFKLVDAQVGDILAKLKNSAITELDKLKSKRQELEEARAKEFYQTPLFKADSQIETITEQIEKKRDYKNAIVLTGSAIQDVNAAIIETKKRHAKIQIEALENKFAEATDEEAATYTPTRLQALSDSFNNILSQNRENQYDTVLGAAEQLLPQVRELVTQARSESIRARILALRAGYKSLNDQELERYLPGSGKVLLELVENADDLFQNGNYTEAKQRANDGTNENIRIKNAFGSLADKTVREAADAASVAKGAFDRQAEVFGAGAKVVDQRLEGARAVEASRLQNRLRQAGEMRVSAAEYRTKEEFQKAVEQAKESQAVADDVTNSTYRLVAQHVLVGIQDQISTLESQGARKSAFTALSQAQAEVEQSQRYLAERQNRDAAESAARARAYVENVRQALARNATGERATAEVLLRRASGASALQSPAARPGRIMMQPQSAVSDRFRQGYPGGAAENDREAFFADMKSVARETAEVADGGRGIVVAQGVDLQASPSTRVTPSENGGNQGLVSDNRAIPDGTFMGAQPAYGPSTGLRLPTSPVPGARNGAIVGTRPEPVVATRDSAAGGSSTANPAAQYESPTGPGPFVPRIDAGGAAAAASAGGAADRLTIPSAGATTAEQVNSLLMDDRRLQDVRKYEPGAITRSRELLRQSAEASNAQNYVRAGELAQQAQQTLVEAENRAAGKSARRDLGAAASRINLAQASSSVLFAPAQVTEAINLYEQAQSSLKYGDNLQARQAAEQAVTAADDARLFNVRKARDLASLSVRYGGWKAASDELISANTAAADAEKMLARTDTAPYGQQVAQQAVQCAQIALDRSRDFTFQERLDNIYKALNTAMRAGANYFNVDEVKRLIAELAVARDEYCTRNFDAVELKLKDIEARLARVIETTPLVLEQNLIHTTDKLNALVLAGAENWMAQEVDDVKTLMNNSAVQFRKHDYQGSYTAIRDALKLVDRIENRLQEQVYYDAVTELFAQLDRAFKDMGPILDYDRTFLKKVIDHPSGQNRALAFAGKSSPNDFRDKVTDIYLRAIHLKPPKKLEGTHNEVLLAVKSAKVSAENFQKLYIMDQVSRPDAYEILDTAFNQVNRSKKLRADIQIRMIEPEARVKVIRAEKIINY